MNLRPKLFDRKTNTRILHDDFQASENLAEELLSYTSSLLSRPIVFVCIGTDRSTGDSLGPLVGTLLEERKLTPFTCMVH